MTKGDLFKLLADQPDELELRVFRHDGANFTKADMEESMLISGLLIVRSTAFNNGVYLTPALRSTQPYKI